MIMMVSKLEFDMHKTHSSPLDSHPDIYPIFSTDYGGHWGGSWTNLNFFPLPKTSKITFIQVHFCAQNYTHNTLVIPHLDVAKLAGTDVQ